MIDPWLYCNIYNISETCYEFKGKYLIYLPERQYKEYLYFVIKTININQLQIILNTDMHHGQT